MAGVTFDQGMGQGASLRRGEQQVEIFVHQHEGVHLDCMLAAGFAQETAKVMPILVVQEDSAAIHAALCHVEWNAG